MKKLLMIFALAVLLCGCGARETFETLGDVYAPQENPAQRVDLQLPENALSQTISGTEGKLYLCDGYAVAVQTLPGGDIGRTVKEISGYDRDKLGLVETKKDGITTFHLVWSSAGEGGDQISRAVILDDGSYHYAVTVMAASRDAGAISETVQEILRSVTLRTD